MSKKKSKKGGKNAKSAKLSKKQLALQKDMKKQAKLAKEFETADPSTTDVSVVLSLPVSLEKANRLLTIADERQIALDDLLASTIDAMIAALEPGGESAVLAEAVTDAEETTGDTRAAEAAE